ncbi:MAG: aldehyde dehydrogenase family protein [Pseudomonadota bacterium]|nr:aldehyde dehydrogenase family protein [Pseudomonadota bacterium]
MPEIERWKEKAQAFLSRKPVLFINGHWVAAKGEEEFDVIDPATEAVIAKAARGRSVDIDAAVSAARSAFERRVWRGKTGAERSAILWRYAELVEQNADELIHLEIIDNGMPYAFAEYVVKASAEWLRHFGRLAPNAFGRNVSNVVSGEARAFHAYSAFEPVGVAGLITPWNGPIVTFAMKVAPALAAGCSVVVKPAENTPITALRMAELAVEAGIPDGVLNVVTGFGAEAGAALAEHPDVDKVSFTGSTAVGKQIIQASAGNLKRITLELGGKSPCIVFDDADMETAIPGAAMAIFANTGQVCFAGSRLFVQRKSFDRVVSGIADFAKSLKVGNGFNQTSALGPLISDKQRERVLEYIEVGRQEGAELIAGGQKVGDRGFFVEPTIFADVNANMRIVKEEIFGPVLTATPFDDMDDMIRQSNATRYGLGAGVYTRDVNKAHYIADRLQSGNVWVNCYGIMHPALPFGGFKESGWGRESGSEGMEAFLEQKSVVIQLAN